jgi:hypothetical protein
MRKRQFTWLFFGFLFLFATVPAGAQDFPKGPINYMNLNPGEGGHCRPSHAALFGKTWAFPS